MLTNSVLNQYKYSIAVHHKVDKRCFEAYYSKLSFHWNNRQLISILCNRILCWNVILFMRWKAFMVTVCLTVLLHSLPKVSLKALVFLLYAPPPTALWVWGTVDAVLLFEQTFVWCVFQGISVLCLLAVGIHLKIGSVFNKEKFGSE